MVVITFYHSILENFLLLTTLSHETVGNTGGLNPTQASTSCVILGTLTHFFVLVFLSKMKITIKSVLCYCFGD